MQYKLYTQEEQSANTSLTQYSKIDFQPYCMILPGTKKNTILKENDSTDLQNQ